MHADIATIRYNVVMTLSSGSRSLRERQHVRTRDDIQAAAFALFTERGYADTTVAQIAERAGVAVRTFFRYFPAKEDVVFGDHADAVARLRAALTDASPDDPPLRRVRQAVIAVQQPGQHPEREIMRARLIVEVPSLRARFHRLAEDFESVVADALREETGSDTDGKARATIVAGVVFGALRGARRAAAMQTGPDPAALIDTAFAIVEEGVTAHLSPRGETGV